MLSVAMLGHAPDGGVSALPNYRLYRLDGAGRILGADWLEAASDDEARSKARDAHGSGSFELWERHRLVERVGGERD